MRQRGRAGGPSHRPLGTPSHQHELDWTECRAEGYVTYANGMRAQWSIEIGGRGALTPLNGRRKGVTYFLSCDACAGTGKPD